MDHEHDRMKIWHHSLYDSDTDIAGPKQISITTGAKKAHVCILIKATGSLVATLAKTLVIGTGGGASAGTAVTPYADDQASTLTPLTVVKQDYVLGSSGQSAGTVIYSELVTIYEETEIELKLAESMAYGLVLTAIADNTLLSVDVIVREV